MKGSTTFNAAGFARLHNINKRTLHYYDDIGLFSPSFRADNGYRCYDSGQSARLQYILALKELGLSLEEIKLFSHNPNIQDYTDIIDQKSRRLAEKIASMSQTLRLLDIQRHQLEICSSSDFDKIETIILPQEKFLFLPFESKGCTTEQMLSHISAHWPPRRFCAGIGSLISRERLEREDWDGYGGFYTPILRPDRDKGTLTRPAGKYIRAYHKGPWENLPDKYRQIMIFAKEKGLSLRGYSFEMGMNDMFAEKPEDYITQILIAADSQNQQKSCANLE